MSDPAESSVQNLLPVQAYFDAQGDFQTFIGQNKPFYATTNPEQSGLHITDSTIDSTTIGATTPSTGVFTNISTTTGQISTAPSGNTDIVNKLYVDAIAQGLKPKQAVKCATTGDITLSGLQTIDTYTTLAGDRVLVKNQTNTAENGIYIAASGAWTRSSDMDVWSEVPGSYTIALGGSANLDTGWVCTAAETGTIGVTAMPWVQFSSVNTYYAGTGLNLASNTFSIANTGVTAATKGSASKTVTATVNVQGQLTSLTDQDIAIAATQVTSGTLDPARLSGSYTGITGVGTLTTGTWNASTIDVAHGGTGATTLTGYVKGSGTSALTASSTIPNSDITGLGTMSTQDASNVAITGGSAALGTLKTLGMTGYLYGNDTSAVTASTTIPNTAITGLGSMSTQNANNVAITGGYATGLTNLGADYLQLNTGATVTPAIGRVWWDGGTTMNMGMTANVTSHISEDTFFYVKASGAITKGQLCAFTGVVGASGVITAAPVGAGITNADYIVGVAAESIASGSFGLIQWFGTLRGFDTSAWVDGDILYYDPAAGGFTTTYPTSGIIVTVAAVINAGPGSSGSILIRPTKTQRITAGSGISVTQTSAGSSVAISSPVSIANGGTNGTATPTAGGIAYGSGTAYAFTSAGTTGQFLQSNGSGTPTWATPVSYASVTDDTTTNSTFYPLFANQTTGNLATEYTSSTKFQYNPSTGTLTASVFSGAGTSLTGTASGLSIGGNAATATSATTATNLAGGANGSVPYQTGSGATTMLAAGSNGQILTLAGGVPTWAAAPVTGVTITDDTTTNATRYLTFTSATTGSITGENVASTKLQFNPSTGALSATDFVGTIGATTPAAGTFTTLTATGQTSLGTGNANYVQVDGAATSNGSIITFTGSDTNVNGIVRTKGAGIVVFRTNTTQEQFRISHTASAVNYVQVTGAATGAAPSIQSTGSDATQTLLLLGRGNGGSVTSGASSTVLWFKAAGTSAGTVVNYLQANASTTTNSPILSAQGSDTNIDLALTPKGTGKLTTAAVVQTGAGTALSGATNPLVAMTGNANQYVQSYIVNNNAGTSASSDFVAYANNSTDSHGWADMGFTSSVYADATYTVTGPNEAYLFGSAPSGAGATGNLVYATDSTGSANAHQFYVGGFTQAKGAWKAQIDSNGLKATQVNATNGIFANSQTVSANYTVNTGDNAMSAGPVTVASGISVTVSSGSVWTII